MNLIVTKKMSKWLENTNNPSLKMVALVLLVLIGGVYANSINSPFYYDDQHLLKDNHKLAESGGLSFLFHQKKYYEVSRESTYRPVTTVVYYFFKNVLHDNPSYCRIFNILLHLANCFLLFIIFRQLKLDEWLSLLAVGLVAVHPLNTELINVITFNEDMIGAFFCLLAFYGYLKEGWGWYIISLFAYLLGCLAKETFVVLPALLFIIDLWKVQGKINWTSLIIRQLSYFIVVLLFLYVNLYLMKDTLNTFNKTYPGGTFASALLTFSVVLIYYVKLFFIPTGLTPFYNFPIYNNILQLPVVASMSIILSVVGLVIYGFKRQKAYAIYLIWFFLFLLPTSNIIPFWAFIAERYLYMPLMGLVPGVLLLVKHALTKFLTPNEKPLFIGGIIFLVFLSIMTIRRNMVWQSPLSLWQDTQQKNTKTLKPQYNLGVYYQKRSEFGKAIHHYNLSALAFPDYPQTFFNLGNIYQALGDLPSARENLGKAAQRIDKFLYEETRFATYFALGGVCFDLGDLAAAVKYWQLGQQINPNDEDLNFNLDLAKKELKASGL